MLVCAGEYVCISIIDTGIGMDEVTLKRAAEPFFTTRGLPKVQAWVFLWFTVLPLSRMVGSACQASQVTERPWSFFFLFLNPTRRWNLQCLLFLALDMRGRPKELICSYLGFLNHIGRMI